MRTETWKDSDGDGGFPCMRRPGRPMQASWNGIVLAESSDTVVVEGRRYFPLGSVRPGVLTESKTRSLCLWKGMAHYFNVVAHGSVNPDAAWTYRHPTILARRIRGKVAFWQGVQVERSPGGVKKSTISPGRNG